MYVRGRISYILIALSFFGPINLFGEACMNQLWRIQRDSDCKKSASPQTHKRVTEEPVMRVDMDLLFECISDNANKLWMNFGKITFFGQISSPLYV